MSKTAKILEYCYDSEQYNAEDIMKEIDETKKKFENRTATAHVTLNEWGAYVVTFRFVEKEKKPFLKKRENKKEKFKLLPQKTDILKLEMIEENSWMEPKQNKIENRNKKKEEINRRKEEAIKAKKIQKEMENNERAYKKEKEREKKEKINQMNKMLNEKVKIKKEKKNLTERERLESIYGSRVYGQYKPTKTYKPL